MDGNSVLHSFVEGASEFDPSLEWYADVAMQSSRPPTPECASDWLREHAKLIRESLSEASERFATGIDPPMPTEFHREDETGPIRVTISAMRRLVGRAIGEKLRRLAETDPWTLFAAPAAAR